jgi:hypothetical protein
MSTDDDLELRLRDGLRAAAAALPPSGGAGRAPAGGRPGPGGPPHRHRPLLIGAAAVIAVAAGVGVAAVGRDADDAPDLQVAQQSATTDSAAADLGPGVDPVPGSAVVAGTELISFGPDGQRGESLSLAPLVDVQSVTSDRHGGWIACGSTTPPEDVALRPGDTDDTAIVGTVPPGPTVPWGTAPTSTVPGGTAPTSTFPAGTAPTATVAPTTTITAPAAPATDLGPAPTSTVPAIDAPTGTDEGTDGVAATPNAYRFRAGEEPEPLPVNVMCVADSLGVTEVDGRQVLAYLAADISIHLLDLETGADRAMVVDIPSGPGRAGVGGGRLAMLTDTGLAVWDLADLSPVAVGPVDLPVRPADATEGLLTSDLALSPDGTRLAALVGDISSSSEVVVVDLASGDEIFRQPVPVSLEGAEIAFDGATVAVGNFYDSYGPVRVYDVASGTERTVDGHGLLP